MKKMPIFIRCLYAILAGNSFSTWRKPKMACYWMSTI